MKRSIALLFAATLVLSVQATTFWERLTPEERKAAGLSELSPEQRAALDAAAERIVREGVRQAVDVAKTEVDETVRRAQEKARAEARAEVQAEVRQQRLADAGLPVRANDEAIQTRILGDFRGWSGNTVFQLENGQTWQQTDRENRFFPKQVNPEVELIPSQWAGWKLCLVREGLWIRVKRLK